MARFIVRRFVTAAAVLAAASVAIFLLVTAAPGDPAKLVAERQSGVADRAAVELARRELGLDDPIPARYVDWVSGAIRGDLGTSYRTRTPIDAALSERLPVTMVLVAGAAVLALVLGFGLAILATLWPGGLFDRASRAAALVGVSIPNFYLGAVLVLLFAVSLNWVPAQDESGWRSWILPWIALGLAPAGVLARVVRVGLAEAMSRPYVTTAAAKGIARHVIVLRDALPNIAVPSITALATQIGLMLTGAVVVETAFAWPGIGAYFLEGVKFRDFSVIQSVLLVFAAVFVLMNALVDIAAHVIDPRLRRATSEGLA